MNGRVKASTVAKVLVGIAVIAAVVAFYLTQLNLMVTNNTLHTIEELAQHDKRSIEAYTRTCWDELENVARRFETYDCDTLLEIQARMNLESATSDFDHIYLLAEDGSVYTDKYVVYDLEEGSDNRSIDFLRFFDEGDTRVVARWDDKAEELGLSQEYVLYGVTLDGFEVEDVPMRAIIGLKDTQLIQQYIVFDSFEKNGERRGYSAVVDLDGNYTIGTQKTIYLDEVDNLYSSLAKGSNAGLTAEQIAQKFANNETFNFNYTDANGVYKLLYFSPLSEDIDWYFMMAVDNVAFTERSNAFASLSVAVLVLVMLVAIVLLLALTVSHYRTVQANDRARSQGEFLSNMSHEIRTPLNGLIGLNHLITTHIDDPDQHEQVKGWLSKSHGTANYLLALVNDILDMSKLQAGKVDIVRAPLLVESVCDAVVSMQCDNVERRGVVLTLDQRIEVPCIMGDAMRLKQVLMNILSNAVKFTPEGGSITLRVRQERTGDSHVTTVFSCQDTGVGMSPEFAATIFDAFSQERHRNDESIKGTGLGMAISKSLMEAMGGTIAVESELGKGSTFTVTLPSEVADHKPAYLEQRTEQVAAQADALSRSFHADRPLKVLVAEDNELNAEILLEILGEEGFEVVHAENGRRAVDLFEASEPGEFDVILMDMQMPVLDGCGAAQIIRSLQRPDARSVIIFACTANTFQEDRDRARASGMDDFLAKPVEIQTMLGKLRAVSELRGHAGDSDSDA